MKLGSVGGVSADPNGGCERLAGLRRPARARGLAARGVPAGVALLPRGPTPSGARGQRLSIQVLGQPWVQPWCGFPSSNTNKQKKL